MLWCNLVCCFEVVQIRMGRQRESFVQNFAIFGQYEQWRRHGGGGEAVVLNPLQTRFSDSCKSGEKFKGNEGEGGSERGGMISGVSQA